MKALILLSLLISGCATQARQWHFDHGEDEEQFQEDYADCEMRADSYVAVAGNNSMWQFGGNHPEFMRKCLRSKGYTATRH